MAELPPGSEFAGCRIDGVAGRGGMGVVYRATQLSLGRPVALKLLAGDRAADPEFRERFQRESRLAAAIDHPNIVPVYAAGEEAGRLYLVMRLVRGEDLHGLIHRAGALGPEPAAAIVAQLAAALDAAHAAGLAHRDVKPANVLLDGQHAYLSDFGLTRLLGSDTRITETGRWLGTVDYASPEQLEGRRCDARSDVYALGCVLYAALVGRPPFPRDTVPASMHAHLHAPRPLPSQDGAPKAFDPVIARALAVAPEQRYPSAGDLGRAALAAARGEPITETERSVARGAAAPPESAERNGHTTEADRTAILPAEPPLARTRRQRRAPDAARVHRARRWPARLVVALAALAIAGGVAALALGLDGGPLRAEPPTGPVDGGEVEDVVRRFASAYGDEDATVLARTLTRDVARFDPGGDQRGRRAVVAQYESQFRGQRTRAYELSDLDVRGGDVGRATGSFEVTRAGARPLRGRVVFDVVRDGGEPRIGLITTTPE